jgi:tetratricopeptide (TPR) repeat protein
MQLDVLKGRADGLLATYHSSHSVGDLEEAIGVYEEILQQCPPEQERRAGALSDLGDALFHFCLNHEAENARDSRCIHLLREALRLRPAGHPLRDQSLHGLARALHFILYHQLDNLNILEECASLNREALRLRPAGHPERLKSMNNLANDLAAIVEHTGDMNMQIEMVSMRREVLQMRPHGHPLRHISLDVLGNALCTSFELSGRSEVLAEAISMLREAVQILSNGHPHCVKALSNLACALWLRAVYEGHLESLSESIDCTREALQLLGADHPLRARIMNNLANSLIASFRNSGDVDMLSTAISLLREAVSLLTPGSYSRDGMINNLAEALEAKFHVDSDAAALSQAASLHRDALALRPVGHPRRFVSLEGLGRVLGQLGCWWSEALSCYQEALRVCPTGSPGRARLLCGVSKCFLNPDSPSFSLLDGIACLSEAYADPLLHVNARLKSAIVDLQHLEAAYNSSRKDAYTRSHAHEEGQILDLYAQVIGLLPLAANFGLDHSVRLQAVTGFDEITRNAAARAVLIGHLPQAVTLLEQGRGVFWAQTLHLRNPAFDGVDDDDCQELERMLRLLDHGACRVEHLQLASAQRESQREMRRQLNEAVQTLIFKIRRCPGLDLASPGL